MLNHKISIRLSIIVLLSLTNQFRAAAIDPVERGNLVTEGVPSIPTTVRERVHRYQSARSARFAGWTKDGGILMETRFGETNQIHRLERPLGARRQITFYSEPVSVSDVSPNGNSFVFRKDTGGDELHQAFVFDLRTGETLRLTEPKTRNKSAIWSGDGRYVAWSRGTSGDPDFDIMISDTTDPQSTRRVALEGKGYLLPVDWSPDGTRLLVNRCVSGRECQLYVLDVDTGNLKEVRPDLKVSWGTGEFTADGKSVIAITDHDSDFQRIVLVSLHTGELEALSTDEPWDVEMAALSSDRQTIVYTLNVGGLSKVRLIDLESGADITGPVLPPGIAEDFRFSPNDRQVAFTFSSYKSPGDIWSFDVASLNLTRWTQSEIGGLNPEGFIEPKLFKYRNADNAKIPAWVYTPTDSIGPHPVLIYIHGGPEYQYRPQFDDPIFQYWLAELGIAIVAPNVRGSTGYGKKYHVLDDGFNRKKSVEDIGALLDWIAEQPDLDQSRVIVYGRSYGGYMVLATMVDYAGRISGGVEAVGISNFVTFLENTKGYRRNLRRAEYGDERDPDMRAFLEKISPANNAHLIKRPLFIIQGANDPRVPVSEAEQMLEAARANDVEVWYLLAKEEGHAFRKQANVVYRDMAISMFLRKTFDLGER